MNNIIIQPTYTIQALLSGNNQGICFIPSLPSNATVTIITKNDRKGTSASLPNRFIVLVQRSLHSYRVLSSSSIDDVNVFSQALYSIIRIPSYLFHHSTVYTISDVHMKVLLVRVHVLSSSLCMIVTFIYLSIVRLRGSLVLVVGRLSRIHLDSLKSGHCEVLHRVYYRIYGYIVLLLIHL